MAFTRKMKTKKKSKASQRITGATTVSKDYKITKKAIQQICKGQTSVSKPIPKCQSTRLVIKLNLRYPSGEIAKQAVLSCDREEYFKRYGNALSADSTSSQESTLAQKNAQEANDRLSQDDSGSSSSSSSSVVYNSIETD